MRSRLWRLLAGALAGGALLVGFAAAAPETETLQASPRQTIKKPPIADVALVGDQTLKSLLAAGFDIIHVDAPVGTLSARFILRKSTTVYSCEPQFYRSGADPNNVTTVISPPCLNLTPDN